MARGPVPTAQVMGRASTETAWTALQKPAVSSGKHLTASALESWDPSASKPTQQPRQLFVSHQEKKAKERQVQRFLYTLWSSKKQPDVQSLAELLTAVRRCMPHRKRAGPLLLHCRYVTILLHPWAVSQSWDPQAAQRLGMATSKPAHATKNPKALGYVESRSMGARDMVSLGAR